MQLLAATCLLVCFSLVEKSYLDDGSTPQIKSLTARSTPAGYLYTNFRLVLSAVCLAVFFPLWLQAVLHFENTAALLMLLVRRISEELESVH